MKQVNRISNVAIDGIAVILCIIGMCLNFKEGITSSSDMFVVVLLVLLLCISAYNLVKSVKKLKDSSR